MVTKGSLRKPDYEPEDKAKERCRNNKMGHGVVGRVWLVWTQKSGLEGPPGFWSTTSVRLQ